MQGTITADTAIDDFILRWAASSGAERANFQSFANELCVLIGVAKPDPAHHDAELNDYTFERAIRFKEADGSEAPGRIDLYKRGAFVMEAKQSRLKEGKKAIPNQGDLLVPDANPRGERSATRAWDVLMINARRQAEDYAKALPPAHGWPPFVLVCDVGHCIEVYADFTGQGKNYAQFPDRQGYRVYLEDLRRPEIRAQLKAVWTEPHSLDPARRSAKVTREIAENLAAVSKALEARLVTPLPVEQRALMTESIALFLMRCLFTMFAEDVELLPKACFTNWLDKAKTNQAKFKHELAQLWQAMDKGGYATIAETNVRRFNGRFFAEATVINLTAAEIGELHKAASKDWREVEPAIFGTLLEQALDPAERSRLGAHYTPRAYVERLVVVTVLEPLRQEWAQVQATAERFKIEAEAATAAGDRKAAKDKRDEAVATVRAFHTRLCQTRVLDPPAARATFYMSRSS